MLKEYLRHSRSFRALFAPLLKGMVKLRFVGTAELSARYRQAVVGGTLVVAPSNMPGEFELCATSDIASRVVLSGCYEPEVTAQLARLTLADGMIVNIGANVGFYSIYLARTFPLATRVLAIEPNPEAFRQLQGNIARNAMALRIEALQTCIGASDGNIELSIVRGMPEYSSIGGIAHPGVASYRKESVQVRVTPLSTLVGSERVSLVFVDTEGAEAAVFCGAQEILARDKPLLFFECSDTLLRKFGGSTRALEAQLRSYGYVVRNGLCPGLALRHPFEGEAIAVHKENIPASTVPGFR
jgi:FkbM family methyltransferase